MRLRQHAPVSALAPEPSPAGVPLDPAPLDGLPLGPLGPLEPGPGEGRRLGPAPRSRPACGIRCRPGWP